MGSFTGHVIPGSFFLLSGFWWLFRIYITYFRSLSNKGHPYESHVSYPPRIRRFPNLNLEAIALIVMGALGIFVEIIAACILRHMDIAIANQQHATMYLFFGFSGSVTLIVPLLKFVSSNGNFEYLCLALAFAVEGLLFKFHLMGRSNLDVTVHTLLLYAIYGNVIGVFLEAKYRHSVLAALTRPFFTILQGTWFWNLAFILYNPIGESWAAKEGSEGHHIIMKTVLVFSWHLAIIVLGISIIGLAMGCWYYNKGLIVEHKQIKSNYESLNECNGQPLLVDEDDMEDF